MKPPTVLVVDDQPASLAGATELLAQAGYEVLLAETGDRALHLARTEQPALILLDLIMPAPDGFAVLAELKAEPALAATPVIIMTGQGDLAERLRGFAAGAVDYVIKPFFPEEVLARVQTHLRLRILQRELEANNRQLAAEVLLRQEAEAQLQQSLDRAVVVATPDGRIQLCTRLARRLIDRWFPDTAPAGLPDRLVQWAAQPGDTLSLPGTAGTLQVRRFADPLCGDCYMLLLTERGAAAPAQLERLGLSAREAEVLYWLAEGKSYKEIAVILSCESRTAQKHAEHIFQKLGVENRHAAGLRAREILDGG